MPLNQLEIEHFRCISKAQLEFSPSRNLIIGENAAGKTSILEAIFLLGSGHSFRTAVTDALIQYQKDCFLIVAKLQSECGFTSMGVRGTSGTKEFRIDGQAAESLGELAKRFPVQVIDPEVHRLLEDGPIRRRKYLDWGVFHVEQQFQDAWRRYSRALRQRNAALRSSQHSELEVWDLELITHGTVVTSLRRRYLEALYPIVVDIGKRLLNCCVEVEINQGWRRYTELRDALSEAQTRDRLRGTTSVGPHRADLVIKVDGQLAKDRISRGQQKMLACVLLLAQQFHRSSISAPAACLLLDDPAAELDVDNLGKLLELVSELPVQLIVSALSPLTLKTFSDAKMFHVEHGIVKGMA